MTTSLSLEEYTVLEERCSQILNDKQITFVGIINKMGNLVAGGFKQGIEPFQSDVKQRMLYMQMVLEISMRSEFDSVLGQVNYTASHRNKALIITVSLYDRIILVSSKPDASAERIVAKINNVFGRLIGERN